MISTVGNLKILDTLTASRDEPVWRFFVRALDYFSALQSVARNVPTCSQKFQSIFARMILRTNCLKSTFTTLTSPRGGADASVAYQHVF